MLHGALQAGAADLANASEVMAAVVASEPLARLDYAEVLQPDDIACGSAGSVGPRGHIDILVAVQMDFQALVIDR